MIEGWIHEKRQDWIGVDDFDLLPGDLIELLWVFRPLGQRLAIYIRRLTKTEFYTGQPIHVIWSFDEGFHETSLDHIIVRVISRLHHA